MQFKTILVALALLVPSAVLAAPTPDANYELEELYQRLADLQELEEALFARMPIKASVSVRPDPSGDYATVASGRASAALKADYTRAAGLVTNLVKNAGSRIKYDAKVDVTLKNSAHTSRSDPIRHYTFSFHAPGCGGKCTGHAYEGSGGKIWSAANRQLY